MDLSIVRPRAFRPRRRALTLIAGAIIVGWATAAIAAVPEFPTVVGPIPDPDPVLGPMFPGIREYPPETMPAAYGYVTEEYFISGTANGQPYKTRVLIRRPANKHKSAASWWRNRCTAGAAR